MKVIETIKENTLWLIGAVLITIPLIACYPILLYFGLSVKVATITTVCLSIIAYILSVTFIEPFLGRMFPFLSPKSPEGFTSAELELGSIDTQKAIGPNSFPKVSDLDILRSDNAIRNLSGNWVHS